VYQLKIYQLARDDIHQIIDYYDDTVPYLTDLFVSELFSDFETIRKNAFLFQLKYRNTRVCYLKKFPFGIHYQINDAEKAIEILAVFHTSRNPKIWENR